MSAGIPDTLQAKLEERARSSFNKELALTALRLRANGDFVLHAVDHLDVISIERTGQCELLKLIGGAIEAWHPRTALDGLEELQRSLKLQIAFAKQLTAYLQADIDQAARDSE